VLVEGVERGKVVSVSGDEGFLRVVLRTAFYKVEPGPQLDALISRVTGLFDQYVKLSQNLNYEQMIAAIRVDDPASWRIRWRQSAAHYRREAGAARNLRPVERLTRWPRCSTSKSKN